MYLFVLLDPINTVKQANISIHTRIVANTAVNKHTSRYGFSTRYQQIPGNPGIGTRRRKVVSEHLWNDRQRKRSPS